MTAAAFLAAALVSRDSGLWVDLVALAVFCAAAAVALYRPGEQR